MPLSFCRILEPNWSKCLIPSCKTTCCQQYMRNLFFLWVNPISKYRMPPQLQNKFVMIICEKWDLFNHGTSYYLSWEHVCSETYKVWSLVLLSLLTCFLSLFFSGRKEELTRLQCAMQGPIKLSLNGGFPEVLITSDGSYGLELEWKMCEHFNF